MRELGLLAALWVSWVAPATAAQKTSRDSAGVAIVHSSAPLSRTAPVLVTTPPQLFLGLADGDDAFLFDGVTDARRTLDGDIYVSVSGSHEIRRFSANGQHELTIGRRGAGPGEFHGFSSLKLFGEPDGRITVIDQFNARIQTFTPDGAVALVTPVSALAGATIVGRFRDGTWLSVRPLTSRRGTAPAGQLVRSELEYYRLSAKAEELGPLIRLRSRLRITFNAEGTMRPFPVPMTQDDLAIAAGDILVVCEAGRPEIRRYHNDGRLIAIHRWSPPRRVTRDVWSRYKEAALADAEPARRPALARFLDSSLPLPDELPAVQSLQADAAGIVWAERFRLPSENRASWDLIGPDGAWIGTVELPQQTEPLEIGSDYLIARQRDSLGVETVALFRIRRLNP